MMIVMKRVPNTKEFRGICVMMVRFIFSWESSNDFDHSGILVEGLGELSTNFLAYHCNSWFLTAGFPIVSIKHRVLFLFGILLPMPSSHFSDFKECSA